MRKNSFVAFLLFCLFLCSCHSGKKSYHFAKNGVCDLSKWNFKQQGIVMLAGEWEFYWNKLLEPHDFKKERNDALKIHVPSTWNNYQFYDQKLSGDGFATYRLKILLQKKQELLALYLPTQATTYKLFVNGHEISSNGKVGNSNLTSVPFFKTSAIAIDSDTTQLEILVQISNFHHIEGGMWHSIFIGNQDLIIKEQNRSMIIDAFMIGSILIMAFYHIGIFILRQKTRYALYFGVFCLLVAIRVGITPNHFENYFSTLSWNFSTFLEIASFIAATPVFILYTSTLFAKFSNKKIIYLMLVIFAIQLLLLIFTSPKFYLHAILYFKLILILEICYLIYILFRALIDKMQGSKLFLSGTLILVIATINDIFVGSGYTFTDYSVQYGLFTFIFIQAYLLSKIFTNEFLKNEKLSDQLLFINNNLENLITQRTIKLQKQSKKIQLQSYEINSAYEKLKEMDKFKEGMMSMIVHDLKNPLNIILNIPKNYSFEQHLKTVLKTGKVMKNLVSNILDVQKYENTAMILNKLPVDLEKMLNNAIEDTQILCEEKNITTNIISNSNWMVYCDHEIVSRIIINLLTNAIKFSRYNSTIEISVIEKPNNKLIISIKDYGVGISKEKQQYIFEKFGQLIAKKSGQFQSTGLGLTFCKMALEAHNETIGIDSTKNIGSTFWFTLEKLNPADSESQIQPQNSVDNSIHLTSHEIEILFPYIEKLKTTDCYKIVAIKKILQKIPENSNNLKFWKQRIEQAVSNQNLSLYISSLNIL